MRENARIHAPIHMHDVHLRMVGRRRSRCEKRKKLRNFCLQEAHQADWKEFIGEVSCWHKNFRNQCNPVLLRNGVGLQWKKTVYDKVLRFVSLWQVLVRCSRRHAVLEEQKSTPRIMDAFPGRAFSERGSETFMLVCLEI